jgi:hypothetical protein
MKFMRNMMREKFISFIRFVSSCWNSLAKR